MDSILQQITDWLKEMLVSAIMGNLSGMFESVNNQVGEIATSVGMTPNRGWDKGRCGYLLLAFAFLSVSGLHQLDS